jgi:signal transduction histidine kinase
MDSPGMTQSQRLVAMGQMAASLAHEIRNPLGSMELYCSLLKKDLKEQPGTLELAERIHEGIRVLDQIIRNCLQFSRDIRLRREVISDVEGYIEDICVASKNTVGESSVHIEKCVAENISFNADKTALAQALINIIKNAIEAAVLTSRSDAIVKVIVEQVDDMVLIAIEDNGNGMDAQTLQKLFDPFFTTKDNGTGLGLSVVHTLIAAHGGAVEVQSQQQVGSRFAVKLPVGTVSQE